MPINLPNLNVSITNDLQTKRILIRQAEPGVKAVLTNFSDGNTIVLRQENRIVDRNYVPVPVVALTSISASYAATSSVAIRIPIYSGSVVEGESSYTGSLTGSFVGIIKSPQTRMVLYPLIGSGTSSFDFLSGSVFYLNGMTGTGEWNIINVPSQSLLVTSIDFVIEQGSTPYSASGYQLNSELISVKWENGIIPTGSTNGTDIINLKTFRSGSTWNVLGKYNTFLP